MNYNMNPRGITGKEMELIIVEMALDGFRSIENGGKIISSNQNSLSLCNVWLNMSDVPAEFHNDFLDSYRETKKYLSKYTWQVFDVEERAFVLSLRLDKENITYIEGSIKTALVPKICTYFIDKDGFVLADSDFIVLDEFVNNKIENS